MRAMLEAMCFQTREVVDAMCRDAALHRLEVTFESMMNIHFLFICENLSPCAATPGGTDTQYHIAAHLHCGPGIVCWCMSLARAGVLWHVVLTKLP